MKVSFYELKQTGILKTIPKLLEKVQKTGLKTILFVESQQSVDEYDKSLWTYSKMAFLPHGCYKAPEETKDQHPLWVTHIEENPIKADVLALTTPHVPSYFNSFDRILDVFDGNGLNAQDYFQQRLNVYKESNADITHWRQNAQGGWDQL